MTKDYINPSWDIFTSARGIDYFWTEVTHADYKDRRLGPCSHRQHKHLAMGNENNVYRMKYNVEAEAWYFKFLRLRETRHFLKGLERRA